MATDGIASFNSLLMFNWHTAQKIERTWFQRFAANVEHSCISCCVVLACSLNWGKTPRAAGLGCDTKNGPDVFLWGTFTFTAGASPCLRASQPMSPREPADVSARTSRCSTPPVCLSLMQGNYLLNLPELFTNFPELFTKFSGTIY